MSSDSYITFSSDSYEYFEDIKEVDEILKKVEKLIENNDYVKASELIKKVLKHNRNLLHLLELNPEDTDYAELLSDDDYTMKLINKICNFYPVIEGTSLYFGSYPQTLKKDSVTIVSDTSDNNGYYIGSDGERYAKVVATPDGRSQYFHDWSIIESGKIYYFKVEPIKWNILEQDNGKYKLICDLIIDNQMFYSSTSTRTIDEKIIYPNNYEYSDIEEWLNYTFLYRAFSVVQLSYIDTTIVDNSLSSMKAKKNKYICNNISDKVYLPSESEITDKKYGYSRYSAREKQLTDYAKAKGCFMYPSNSGMYWLRSPYSTNSNYVCCIHGSREVNNTSVGVVPALTINLIRKCEKHLKSDWILKREATCTKKGFKHKECTVCKAILDVEEINAKGHIESDWIIDVKPTCRTSGIKHKECTICGETLETKKIETLEHNYINDKCSVCGSIKGVLEIRDNYVYLGEYPQTLKDDSVTIVSDTPDNNGYYLGSDGERYAKVVAKPSCSYASPIIYFNNSSTIVIEGTTYYFKVESIKWKIESEKKGTYKLISDVIIDNQMYHSSQDERIIDGQTIYANNYEYSDIRTWLNTAFLNQAFTTIQQMYIDTTIVDNSVTSTRGAENCYICNNTLDKIYLPSVEEMTKKRYGYSNDCTKQDLARKKQLTDYAKAKGCMMSIDSNYYNNGYYWLRSPNTSRCNYVEYVTSIGNVPRTSLNKTDYGVVPALSITIK